MKRTINIVLLLMAGYLAVSQDQVMLKGQTRDTTLAVIPFANVLAKDTTTKEMEAFAVTDTQGNFQLRLKRGKVYEIQVTYVGFVPYSVIITPETSNDEPFIILLKEAINALDEVTVVTEIPVLVRGDTISYKAEAFTDGDERKLEDVLEDLPGFEITENGDIQVQGQDVDKLLVDGKEFFDGDTKLATQNIPADVVDRVQVLQNFNDIAPMQGLGNDDRLALNIELKKDKKRLIFGDVTAGAGPEERYFGHANTFYYAPKTSVNFIGDANNIGQLPLTINDYFRMNGGLASLGSRNGTNIQINSADADIPVTDRNSAQSLNNKLAAFNFTTNVTDKLRFSGFLIGFDNRNRLGSNALRIYPQLDESTEETLISTSRINNQSGLGRFSATYTPTYDLQVDYNFFGKRGDIFTNRDRNSQLLTGENTIRDDSDRAPSNQTHQVRMFNALNEKNIVSAELSYARETSVFDRTVSSNSPLFSDFLSTTSGTLEQRQTNRSNRFDGVFNYYYLLNSTTHVNGAYGYSYSSQSMQSDLFEESVNLQNLDEDLDISNHYVSFSFRKKWNKLTINPGVSLNNYHVKNRAGTLENSQYVFPRFIADYDFGSMHGLRISYQQSLEYDDVGAYTEGYLIDSYNTLTFGNSQLAPAVYHTINANYRNYNSYNFFNIYGGINYQYIKDGFAQNQELNGIENVLTSINTQAANQIVSGYANLEKRFNHWRVSGNAMLSYTDLTNQLENQDLRNTNFTQQYRLNSSAKLFKVWSVRAGYTIMINEYTSGDLSNTFLNLRYNASTVLSLKGFQVEVTYTYNQYDGLSQNTSSSFDVLDVTMSYRKPKSPWEFGIQGLNLLDTQEVRRDSFSNNLISTYSYYIQPRYGVFTVMFDL